MPYSSAMTIAAFLLAAVLVMWRPKGLNEAFPALGGAVLVVGSGAVPWRDVAFVWHSVSGAAITIVATMFMAIALESAGLFRWAADGLMARTGGSGIRLFWYVNALCLLMTLFFNNDGSILITTPIIILLLGRLGLSARQKIPYLISGALVATASSVLVGVSNVVNLISLNMIQLTLAESARIIFVPALFGLSVMAALLFFVHRNAIPRKLPPYADDPAHDGPFNRHERRLQIQTPHASAQDNGLRAAMPYILLFVLAMRLSLFFASYAGLPVEYVALAGSLLLLGWRWAYLGKPPADIVQKTPWHVFVFAFGMYIIIRGLQNMGLTEWLAAGAAAAVDGDLLKGVLIMGGMLTALSNMFNNHPALMVGTLTLSEMNLPPDTLHVYYLANLIGSDIGSLLLPVGTLASLIWLHILRRHRIRLGWSDYIRTTAVVIPPAVICTLVALYVWTGWVL